MSNSSRRNPEMRNFTPWWQDMQLVPCHSTNFQAYDDKSSLVPCKSLNGKTFDRGSRFTICSYLQNLAIGTLLTPVLPQLPNSFKTYESYAGINFIQNHQTPGTRLEGSKNPPPGTIIVYKNPPLGTKQGVKSPALRT